MSEVIVYQVRSLDIRGNPRIVHAYETEDAARKAIEIMRTRSNSRYIIVPVENRPDEHWGINFSDKKS
jgi:hypothetical protein